MNLWIVIWHNHLPLHSSSREATHISIFSPLIHPTTYLSAIHPPIPYPLILLSIIHLSMHSPVYQCTPNALIHKPTPLSIHFVIHLCIDLSICPSIYITTYPSIYLLVLYPVIYAASTHLIHIII